MFEQPLFSVLIANYNNTKYLLECVESVLNQSYKNWEIIIVDDCSTEETKVVYDWLLQDSRIKIFFNESNYKTAYTFKRAYENSEGDICGFLGPDDTLAHEAIQKTVEAHLCNPDASIVYTQNYICDNNLQNKKPFLWGGILPNNESQLTAPAGKKVTAFLTFKRFYYEKTVGIDPKFTRGFDQDITYKLEEVGDVVCINDFLYYYRQHDNNISLNSNRVKAYYWLYVANREAYHRRRKNRIKIKNLKFGEVQKFYLKVCLLKIDQKYRNRKYNNLFYYYCQIARRIIWDTEFFAVKAHIHFFKRFMLKLIKNREGSPLQYN